jgi:hypothetical protein
MPRSDDFGECNFITTGDRMQHMTATNDEARLNLVEHIAGVLLYFYIDEDMSEEEIDDASNNCGDIASVLVQSMNLDIHDVESENSFKTSVNLKDFEKFMTSLQDRTVIGD